MVRQIQQLTARSVAAAIKPGLYSDGLGLYLQVARGGSKSWIYRYMLRGRSHDMGLGGVDVVSLSESRELALEARKLVKAGLDPIEERRAQRARQAVDAASMLTFADCADRYINSHEKAWKNPKHRQQWRNTLETYVFPIFGCLPVDAVDTGMVVQVIEPIWTAKTETTSRVRGRKESVLDWAKARGFRSGENPARWRGHLSNLLPKPDKVRRVKHHAALHYDDVPAFMQALRKRDAVTARGLEFLILTAARAGEVVGAQWDDIDLVKVTWVIPGERMTHLQQFPTDISYISMACSAPRVC